MCIFELLDLKKNLVFLTHAVNTMLFNLRFILWSYSALEPPEIPQNSQICDGRALFAPIHTSKNLSFSS